MPAVALLALTGCAGQGLVRATQTLPIKCVTEMRATDKTVCGYTSQPDWFICGPLVLKAECVKTVPKGKERKP